MNMTHWVWTRWLALLACTLFVGCASSTSTQAPSEHQRRNMIGLILPADIQIQPFTKFASFDEDDIPDGILCVLRPVDRFGDPVKAVGFFYFELWSYRNASGDKKGERLAFWDQAVDSGDHLLDHWTRAQMFEFQLGWDADTDKIKPGRKYVLTATYRSPWDETLQDQTTLELVLPPELMEQVSVN